MMGTHVNQTERQAADWLTGYGDADTDTTLFTARLTPGQEVEHVIEPGVVVAWITYTPPSQPDGFGRYMLSVCTNHDDEAGCCDTCGRWAKDATRKLVIELDLTNEYLHMGDHKPSPSVIAGILRDTAQQIEDQGIGWLTSTAIRDSEGVQVGTLRIER